MNPPNSERLYNLLPAIYRIRDIQVGEPLRALLGVIETELQAVEADLDGLYANWFIETCAEWVVPYLGDLLGARALHSIGDGASLRPYVANTLRYRRRKGTALVLEALARDVTGWPAHAVEFFQALETTQHFNHVRPGNLRTPDLRDTNRLELLGGPFESAAHTADVRHISSRRGRYNIPNVGIFLWRLQPYDVSQSSPRPVSSPSDGRYRFNPLGLDQPLFNQPQTESGVAHLAEEINVPGRLRRRPLRDELEARRQALADSLPPGGLYFGVQPVLEVFLNGSAKSVPPQEIMICDLSDPPVAMPTGWHRPPASRTYIPSAGGAPVKQVITVGVDPVLGRLAFPDGVVPTRVEVSYAYGFSGDVGGGPYNRQASVMQSLRQPVTWQVAVGKSVTLVPHQVFATLAEAVQEWNLQPAGQVGIITVLDSRTYPESLTGANKVVIPEGSQLTIVAADWPEVEVSPGNKRRPLGRVEADLRRPHLLGDVSVVGSALAGSLNPGELVLNGLLIEGGLKVLVGGLGRLRLVHSTLVPASGGLTVNPSVTPDQQNLQLTVTLDRSICGPISLPDTVSALEAIDSIIDNRAGTAIGAPGADCQIQTSTILGTVTLRGLQASESIFTDTVIASRRQAGCVRFCSLTLDSKTPRQYRCQPNLALEKVTDPAQQAAIAGGLKPCFTSVNYGDPAYLQLGAACAVEIRTGAEDGAEMGVFSHLKQPQREANLRTALDEYLRFGLEAGSIFAT